MEVNLKDQTDKTNKNEATSTQNPPQPTEKINTELAQEAKINKPEELKNFDVSSHFKKNIVHFDKNCTENITDHSYYCFNCKKSVCDECGVYDHKEHLLIQRESCLNNDTSFFNEISKYIEESLLLDQQKEPIKASITNSINRLKSELDTLHKQKLEEIDSYFLKLKNNIVSLKENYLKVKEAIENYYKINKKFFNIHSKIKENVDTTKENKEAENKLTIESNNNAMNMIYTDPNQTIDINTIFQVENHNKDIENTIFLMNFELMNLCDNKNLQILDTVNKIKNQIANIKETIDVKTNDVSSQIQTYLNYDAQMNKFDDFYWDVKLRTQKYSEHIKSFKTLIYDILINNGNFEKLKDLVSLFDAKNNKGKDVLFNQDYFIKMNDITTKPVYPKKTNIDVKKLRDNSRGSKLASIKTEEKKVRESSASKPLSSRTSLSKMLKPKSSLQFINKAKSPKKMYISIERDNLLTDRAKTQRHYFETMTDFNRSKNARRIFLKKDDIILNQRVLERFFAYSIMEVYSKFFKNSYIPLVYTDLNINYLKEKSDTQKSSLKDIKSDTQKTSLRESRYDYLKSSSRQKGSLGGIKESHTENTKNQKEGGKEFILRSTNMLANYTERYNNLKEKAKPIPHTNIVQVFDITPNKLKKMKLKLTKEEHGYTVFPDGCRHVLVEHTLYITGGADNCGTPINVVLSYDILTNTLKRLPNLLYNHSYHSIDYLENYDCIIVVGGENSKYCEIMDLANKKWTRLPEMNFQRANTNIYYNNVTNDLFALFGMNGNMNERPKNVDTIEVLELKDIASGWLKVDYYKSVGLDLKSNYCVTMPYTREKLLIYGCHGLRNFERKLFALFDMIKSECIKIDTETMNYINAEQKKIRAFNSAFTKNI